MKAGSYTVMLQQQQRSLRTVRGGEEEGQVKFDLCFFSDWGRTTQRLGNYVHVIYKSDAALQAASDLTAPFTHI